MQNKKYTLLVFLLSCNFIQSIKFPQINIPSKGFVLPSWFPFQQKIESSAGILSTFYAMRDLETINQQDKVWIDTTIRHLKETIQNAKKQNKSPELINDLLAAYIKHALTREYSPVSEFDFIKKTLGLKNRIIANISPEYEYSIIELIEKELHAVINKHNPHKNSIAVVEVRNDMSPQEKEWRNNRLNKTVIPKQKELINSSIDDKTVLNIGIAMSGGGYRAMTLTSGYLKGLEDIGVLDSSLYVSALSGSSWFLAPWISRSISIENIKNLLKESIKNDNFNILGLTKYSENEIKNLLLEIIWPKKIFNQQITSIDFFGSLLAKALLYKVDPYAPTLSQQYRNIQYGNSIFPLYSAISIYKELSLDHQYYYHWYEFNPVEVSNLELGYTIPTWSFGRSFYGGASENFAPEQKLSFLMGLWGSAYTFNIKDIKKTLVISYENFNKNSDVKNKLTKPFIEFIVLLITFFEKLFGALELPPITAQRISPAILLNPWKGIKTDKKTAWLANKETITLVDGGIEFNISAVPLFFKNRNLDLIIICDSSASVGQLSKNNISKQLDKLFQYLQKRGYSYQEIVDYAADVPAAKIYKSISQNAPLIMYFNFQKDMNLMNQLLQQNDPLSALIKNNNLIDFDYTKLDYTKTFNFNYTTDNFNQLSSLGEFVIKAHKNQIISVLKKLYQEKLQKNESSKK